MSPDSSYQFPELVLQELTPKTFLGEPDAENEWAAQEKPVLIFLPTRAYTRFKDPDVLYLFGRRGTGKTTLLHMLRHEIRTDRNPHYSYVWMINTEDAYHELSIQFRTSALANLPQDDIVHLLVKKWHWVLKVSAMLAVVIAHHENKKGTTDNDIASIVAYLRSERLLDQETFETKFGGSPFVRLVEILTDEMKAVDYAPARTAGAIASLSKRLLGGDFDRAHEALVGVLKRSKKACLILIDSVERHDIRDPIAQGVMTALIQCVKQQYDDRHTSHILAKAAFPSELYPYLWPLNMEKTEGRNLFILWRYRDLVSVLAKRYWQLLHTDDRDRRPEVYARLNDSRAAREFLYEHFPKNVVSRTGVTVDTLAYIVRHTQKKPRQVIFLANVIPTLAETRLCDIRGKIPPDVIVEGIHARLDILVSGSLDVYRQLYRDVEQLVRRTLTRAQSYCDYATLDSLMKEVHALRTQADMSVDELRRLLFECGALGVECGKHNLREAHKVLMEALFEYQVKGILFFTNRQRCAVHPMFYQELQIDVDRDTFVYPKPAEDEEKEDLREAGMELT